jgi:hypothetical protein
MKAKNLIQALTFDNFLDSVLSDSVKPLNISDAFFNAAYFGPKNKQAMVENIIDICTTFQMNYESY